MDLADVVVIPIKSSLADWNWVPTGSMNPTILEGDLVYVDKVAYDLRFPLTLHRLAEWSEPQRGDIVVCVQGTEFFHGKFGIFAMSRALSDPLI